MELWLILLAPVAFVLGLVITAVVVIGRRHARIRNLRRAAAAGGPQAAMAALRDRSLRASAKELGQRADLAVWGLVVDLAMPSGVATLVALDDGHASLYTSTGGGVLGFGAQPAVKSAAERLVAVARNHVAAMTPTSNFSLPAQNSVRFYVLAAEGVRTAEVAEPDLASGASPFSPLFMAAHELLSQLRLASSRPTTSP